jgi:hypothetical protein
VNYERGIDKRVLGGTMSGDQGSNLRGYPGGDRDKIFMYAGIYNPEVGGTESIASTGQGHIREMGYGITRSTGRRIKYIMAGRNLAEQQRYITEQEKQIVEPSKPDSPEFVDFVNRMFAHQWSNNRETNSLENDRI